MRGFDFGNSPTEIEAAELPPGAMVVPSTTNGTRIIEVAQGAFAILAGAFVNAHTVADELAVGACGERVAVIGCGWEGGRASEDESAAGVILCRLRQGGVRLDERARRVVELYLRAPKRRCAGTAPLEVSHASGTGRIPISASPRIPCRSSLFSKALPSRAGGRGVLAVGPNRGGGKRLDIRQNILDKGVTRHYSEVGHGGSNVTSFAKPPRRGGADNDDNHYPREG